MRQQVLIVDDETEMRSLVEMYLVNAGYSCIQAGNGEEALKVVQSHKVDLILLDIMMPGDDGFTLCEKLISQMGSIPIIFLSAKGEEWDKIKALHIGADDYIVKPFHPGELVARVEAVLRRTSKSPEGSQSSIIEFCNIVIEAHSRSVYVSGKLIQLTLKEYELLAFLIKNKNQVLSREQLLYAVWGADYFGSLRTVDTHIKTLRMKLKQADYIQTVRGVGYKFGGCCDE